MPGPAASAEDFRPARPRAADGDERGSTAVVPEVSAGAVPALRGCWVVLAAVLPGRLVDRLVALAAMSPCPPGERTPDRRCR